MLFVLVAASAFNVPAREYVEHVHVLVPCLGPGGAAGTRSPLPRPGRGRSPEGEPIRLRGGAGAKAKDKKAKTKNKRGGTTTQRGGDYDWDASDDDGGGGFVLTDEEKEQMAREERILAEASAAAPSGGDGMRRGAGGTFHQLRCMPEETPPEWDPCADWDLRVRSKIWWKDQRDRGLWEALPSPLAKMLHACRVGAVPWVRELLVGGAVVATATDPCTPPCTPHVHLCTPHVHLPVHLPVHLCTPHVHLSCTPPCTPPCTPHVHPVYTSMYTSCTCNRSCQQDPAAHGRTARESDDV